MSNCTCHKHVTDNRQRLTVNGVLNADPTRTTLLRTRFAQAMARRFRELLTAIRISIVENDAFGLREPDQSNILTLELEPIPPKAFDFARSSQKVEAFLAWLNTQYDQGILEKVYRPGALRGLEEAWTDVWINRAYKRGVVRARGEIRKLDPDVPKVDNDNVDAVIRQPIHADRLGAVYTRTFQELKGITADIDKQVSRILADSLAAGENPRVMYKKLVDIFKVNGEMAATGVRAINRAKMVARTEIIRAHHIANINEYRNWGMDGVEVIVEWSTAGIPTPLGNPVCPICRPMEGKTFTLDEAEGMIPAHPNCRCTMIPTSDPDYIDKIRQDLQDDGIISPTLERTKEEEKAYQEGLRKQLKELDDNPSYGYFAPQKMELRNKLAYSLRDNAKAISAMRLDAVKQNIIIEGGKKPTKKILGQIGLGVDYIPYDILQDVLANDVNLIIKKDKLRASYDPDTKNIWLHKGNDYVTVAHEMAHAIDHYNGEMGMDWGSNKYVTPAVAKRLRDEYNKLKGPKNTYSNGDGDYYEDNWLSNYEGRIYDKYGIGLEWFSMNNQRFSQKLNAIEEYKKEVRTDKRQLTKLNKELKQLKDLKKVMTDNPDWSNEQYESEFKKILGRDLSLGETPQFLDNNIDMKKDEIRAKKQVIAMFTAQTPEAFATKRSQWGKVQQRYPELASFIESNYGRATHGTY